jgi:hypothetical protein
LLYLRSSPPLSLIHRFLTEEKIMAEETGMNVGPRGHNSGRPSSVNAVDPAAQPGELRNLAFSNLVVNTNLAQQKAVSNQQAINESGIAVVGGLVNVIITCGTEQAPDVNSDAGESASPSGSRNSKKFPALTLSVVMLRRTQRQ